MIAIINCGFNIASIEFAFQRLGKKTVVTLDPHIIQAATHVILPGVGYCAYAIEKLRKNSLISIIQNLKKPVLGICLGMQILCEFSDEGNVKCLNLFPEKVFSLPDHFNLVRPHMGWNQLQIENPSLAIINGIKESDFVYFVHSYYVPTSQHTVASTKYGIKFSAIFQYKNFIGTQFHPEKSGKVGEKLLSNFLEMS